MEKKNGDSNLDSMIDIDEIQIADIEDVLDDARITQMDDAIEESDIEEEWTESASAEESEADIDEAEADIEEAEDTETAFVENGISDEDLQEIEFSLVDEYYPEGILSVIEETKEEEEDGKEVYTSTAKRKRTGADYVRYGVMFVALCVLVYSVFSLITIFLEYKAAEDAYSHIADTFVDHDLVPSATPNVQYVDEEYPLNPNFKIPSIDWAGLKARNEDVCAWIQFETLSEEINYPVLQGTNNEYYLKHTTDHEENSAGSIFLEAQNRSDFTDMNTFIYGHNMKNGSMFGLLRYYKDASYYTGNEYFWIYTPQANYRYKIFSCYEPKAESETYTWWSEPCEEFTKYLQNVTSYSKYSTGVTVRPDDHIVTLSTCTSRGSDYRFVVHGKLVYSSIHGTGQPEAVQPEAVQPDAALPAEPGVDQTGGVQ